MDSDTHADASRRTLAHRSVVEEYMVQLGTAAERSARTIALFGSLAFLLIGIPVGVITLGAIGIVAPLLIAVFLCVRFEFLVRRARTRIVSQRLCLSCGYTLLRTPVDGEDSGRCPECGRRFWAASYAG
ncbi:MAG: hypothetical protein HKO59_03925 [Phycisphaerales bacterium]|nr:hypothetical protein [Phycisphaerae bacterium]NNF42013.1 hypothetical protein [Phycisphaerales bacterium]NNM25130.1 hypothetical protein [Phycisphaerales bacterium]